MMEEGELLHDYGRKREERSEVESGAGSKLKSDETLALEGDGTVHERIREA